MSGSRDRAACMRRPGSQVSGRGHPSPNLLRVTAASQRPIAAESGQASGGATGDADRSNVRVQMSATRSA